MPTGDESTLPAVAGILESLPPGTPAHVWIALRHAADRACPADLRG
ncbi:SIP domain-containing protein [Streptomyces sp. NPDC051217]